MFCGEKSWSSQLFKGLDPRCKVYRTYWRLDNSYIKVGNEETFIDWMLSRELDKSKQLNWNKIVTVMAVEGMKVWATGWLLYMSFSSENNVILTGCQLCEYTLYSRHVCFLVTHGAVWTGCLAEIGLVFSIDSAHCCLHTSPPESWQEQFL